MRLWTSRQWVTAAVASVIVALIIGLPTDVIPNPVFGRPVDITWWSYPTLVVTAVLGGLLAATYVRVGPAESADENDDLDRPGRLGGIGGVLSFFAVGCPVCNKLVVIALGTTGALEWFAPAQPILAVASILLLIWALRTRLRNATSCRVPGTIREDRDEPAMMSE
jgi:H+/Cl- antiporter ClcA